MVCITRRAARTGLFYCMLRKFFEFECDLKKWNAPRRCAHRFSRRFSRRLALPWPPLDSMRKPTRAGRDSLETKPQGSWHSGLALARRSLMLMRRALQCPRQPSRDRQHSTRPVLHPPDDSPPFPQRDLASSTLTRVLSTMDARRRAERAYEHASDPWQQLQALQTMRAAASVSDILRRDETGASAKQQEALETRRRALARVRAARVLATEAGPSPSAPRPARQQNAPRRLRYAPGLLPGARTGPNHRGGGGGSGGDSSSLLGALDKLVLLGGDDGRPYSPPPQLHGAPPLGILGSDLPTPSMSAIESLLRPQQTQATMRRVDHVSLRHARMQRFAKTGIRSMGHLYQ